jgi:hypothetical protein
MFALWCMVCFRQELFTYTLHSMIRSPGYRRPLTLYVASIQDRDYESVELAACPGQGIKMALRFKLVRN